MKKILILCLGMLLIYGVSAAQTIDTTFIFRKSESYYHAIYIENNRSAKEYNFLLNAMTKIDLVTYSENILELKNYTSLSRNTFQELSTNWQPLHLYMGNYYVYFPSDFMYNNWAHISDSIFLQYGGGDLDMYAIVSLQKNGNTKFRISTINLTGRKGFINIYVLDPNTGVALFEFENAAEETRYQLMVDAANIRKFPLIVNYCREQKQDEFEFEQPDFKKLIMNAARVVKEKD